MGGAGWSMEDKAFGKTQIALGMISRNRIFLTILLVASVIYMQQSCGRISARELLVSIPLGSRLTDIDKYPWREYSTGTWVSKWERWDSLPESVRSGLTQDHGPLRTRFGKFRRTFLDSLEELDPSDRIGFTGQVRIIIYHDFLLPGDGESVDLTYIDGVLKEKSIGSIPG